MVVYHTQLKRHGLPYSRYYLSTDIHSKSEAALN